MKNRWDVLYKPNWLQNLQSYRKQKTSNMKKNIRSPKEKNELIALESACLLVIQACNKIAKLLQTKELRSTEYQKEFDKILEENHAKLSKELEKFECKTSSKDLF